ncbi:MAG: 1,2-phenylacetyl-CoA epoxidase subunit PaaD [Bacteroidota bacterium]
MVMQVLTKEKILEILHEIKDPEIPAVSIVEMGMVRDVEINGNSVNVIITPTYSGCPAIKVIELDIAMSLKTSGISNFNIRQKLSPPWTTDWMSDETKEKLRKFGIAPPGKTEEMSALDFLEERSPEVRCPYCGSEDTELKSEFSSTACKSMYMCHACSQPFEHFKCH